LTIDAQAIMIVRERI